MTHVSYLEKILEIVWRTITRCSISNKSLLTRTAIRTITVGAISVFIARARIRRTLVYI